MPALEDTMYGVIRLERQAPEYGDVRRRLSISQNARHGLQRRLPQFPHPQAAA